MTVSNNIDAAKEAWIAGLAEQIQARMQDQPAPDEPALQPPTGLSPAQLMAWARANQPPVVELQPARPAPAAPVVVPPEVLAMPAVERAKWVRRQQRQGA